MAKNNDNNSSRHIENLFLVLLSLLLAIVVTVTVVLFTKIETLSTKMDNLKDGVYKIESENSVRHITITKDISAIPKCEMKMIGYKEFTEHLEKDSNRQQQPHAN
ncbi:MAG: hypothetical protein HQL03_08500 [Nitrospirae bacterium]|nr:hypothetical protein [Nitrospirota bacterium]